MSADAPTPPPRAPMRRRKRPADKRGVALVMVLGALAVLEVFLTELKQETTTELASAYAERDALRAEYYARSGVNLARLLIASEPEIRKSVAPMLAIFQMKAPQIPVWEFTDMVLGPFNDAAGASSFAGLIGADPSTGKNLGLSGGGRFELKIVDEDSKVNLNMAARNENTARDRLGEQLLSLFAPASYATLFEARDADNQFSDKQTICGALVDWADSEPAGNDASYPCDPRAQNNSNAGLEDNYYQVIGLPYRRKNAAYDSMEEARLVRGVGDDFWATFVDPDPTEPKKRIMTVWGQGTINVNSANAITLLALACGGAKDGAELCNDLTQIDAFIQGVSIAKTLTMGLPLFGSTNDFIKAFKGEGQIGPVLTTMGVKPIAFRNENDLKKQIGLNSKMFSIYAEGVIPHGKRETRVRIHTVVDFRVAAPIGQPSLGFCGAGQAATGGSGQALPQLGQQSALNAAQNAPNNQPASQAPADVVLQMLNTNPAGTVVYWRVE